ncbi:MAG: thiosulfohydrolase SoxB [Rhizobiales bacterium 62-17]|mgnify:CR=1 FL=1|nr:thiosulfohydrolase SoxB [Hyphomicrobiales bacterium]OJY02785.1 MAG: thiosulfohydrolase SoxB [Rhizobiales bacterium 62-17]
MISRRHFLQASASASTIVAASGLGPLGRVAAQQRLSQNDILRFDPLGSVTILHVTDIHAQLAPLYFREPSVNIGVGADKGLPPHLTDAAFRDYFKIATGSADQYALTSDDFVALARNYGRMGGVDRLATLIKAIRTERGADKVLLLDGGDTWQGSWTSLQSKGQDMVDVQAALGIEAMVSHWEFTYGAERVKEIIGKAPFAFLAQNIRDKEWQEPVFDARRMFEKGGVKIAVIGQAFPRTPISNPAWMIPDWEFGLREEDLQKQVDESRAEGAQVVVLLSHNGFDVDRKLASRVKGIDVILTAHTHDAMPGAITVDQTVLIASGSHGKFLSRLDLDVRGGKVNGYRFKLMPVFSDAISADAEMQALVQKLRAPHEKDLQRELGRTESLLYRRGNFNGTFDDLICNAMLTQRDAEISLSPGFRWGGSLVPGDAITFEALSNATAMTYPACYRMDMSGAQLKAILEDVADNIFHPDPYFQGGGDMVRIGGMGYTIDVSKPINSRISDMTFLKTGQPIDPSRNYKVAGWASINQATEGPPIWDVVEKHLSDVKTVRLEPNTSVIVRGA